MCIVNGRFNDEIDNYTLISARGKSVVHYFIVSADNLNTCTNFEVYKSRANICDIMNIELVRCIPDHSLLSLTVKIPVANILPDGENQSFQNPGIDKLDHVPESYFKRYKVTDIPENFLATRETNDKFICLNEQIVQVRDSNDIKNVYNTLCEIYYQEMNK